MGLRATLFNWIVGPRSTIAVLRRLMTRKQWTKLCSDTPDWRHLFANAAMMLNLPEDRLLREVAQRSGFAYLPSVKPIDLSLLGRELTISRLRRCGAIALVSGGRFSGFACLDPMRLIGVRESKTQGDVFISSWFSIAQALDESERSYLARQAAGVQERAKRREVLAKGVLELALDEAERFGGGELQLEFKEENVRYSFLTPVGKEAWGSIDGRIGEALLGLLRLISQERGYQLKSGRGGVCRELKAVPQTVGTHPGFRLTWRRESNIAGQEHGVVVSDGSSFPQVSQVILNKESSEAVQVNIPLSDKSCSTLSPAAASQELMSRVLPFPGRDDNSAADNLPGEPPVYQPMVLIIDDNQTFIRVLERFLRRQGLQVVASGSCEEAVQSLKAKQVTPDLVICDIHMPGMNGFDFLKWLRAESHIAAVPFVMLSSDEDVESKLRVLNGGADAFVGKTEDPRILCAQVKQLIERRKAA